MAHTARIVVFWNPDTVHVDLLSSSAQAIHLSISCLITQLKFKHNGEAVSAYEVSDFNDCCFDTGLRDATYTGCHYTWSNGMVWSKLDRVLINPFWSSLHSSAHVHFATPGAFSDHSPAAVKLDSYVQGRRNFKFFNMWAAHDQFLGVVSSCWLTQVYGTPMYTLCRKLKLLKGPLKELNRLHFSHISERVSSLESHFDQIQSAFQHDRDNQSLFEQDKALRSKLSSLKFAEHQFFS
uniref:Endonuclease/exonuclease/phosphatase domain-containing protein n=1 Tax=Populus alba TaxID=43335 RepID=A0A4U5PUI5_POPAL|nr:hypothetical protein D5086_0000177960 [Populus alba]